VAVKDISAEHPCVDGTELIFTKRSDVADFLGALRRCIDCYREEESDDSLFIVPHLLEAQTSYWMLVNDNRETGEESFPVEGNDWC
jgi:hypothetical protein